MKILQVSPKQQHEELSFDIVIRQPLNVGRQVKLGRAASGHEALVTYEKTCD